MKTYLIGCLILTMPLLGKAQQIPESYREDLRVKHVAFQKNNVVAVPATTFTATQIVFGKEEVLAVEGGDTAGWIITYHDNLPNMIFIKPTLLNSNTNMTVVTNKHYYYFHITSNQELNSQPAKPIYALKFSYPEEENARKEAKRKENLLKKERLLQQHKDPKTLNWNYRFSGNVQMRPIHVYDDGRFTYFELHKNQAVPAVFAVDDTHGKEAIVNTRRQGDILVIQRIAPQFTLRNGTLVATVFNANEISRIKPGRR